MLVVPTDQADDKRDAKAVADENQAMRNMPKRNARKIKGEIKMNRYSWHTSKEKDDGGWYKCSATVVFPGNTLKFNDYPFYKPKRKGGHTHNALTNKRLRQLSRSKNERHWMRQGPAFQISKEINIKRHSED